MAAPALVEPARRPARPDFPRPVTPRIVRATAVGTVAALAILLGRSSGALGNGPGLLVAAVLVLLVPTSRDLCRRVLLAGCLLLGWTQLLWWWPLPVGGLGRVTIGLAVLAGLLAGWVGWAERPGRRARLLLPRWRPVDALLPVSVALGALQLQPWLQVKTSAQTLGMLMGGWDNSAHFSMIHMIRRYGVTVDLLGAPPGGETWQFNSYPQGFHTVAATIIEVMVGPRPGSVGAELLAYSQTMAVIVIAATTMLVAGFCALPALRSRPGLAAPVAAFVAAVFYVGPGAASIQGGIGNFTVACALVVAIALVGVPLARVTTPLPLAAICGAVVGVASSWVLLLVLAGPAALAVLAPLRRRRWVASRAAAAASMVLVVAVAYCLWRTVVVISHVEVASPLTINGGTVPVDLGLLLAATLGTFGACLMVRRGSLGAAAGAVKARVATLAAVPMAGLAVAIALIVVQVEANGKVTYYGFKFMVGAETVMLLLLAIPVAHLVSRRRGGDRRAIAAVRGFVASTVAALALTQVFGLAGLDLAGIGLVPEAEGTTNLRAELQTLARPPSTADLADRIDRLRRAPGGVPAEAFYVDARVDRPIDTILAAQWSLALTDSWLRESNHVAAGIRFVDPGPGAAGAVRWIIANRPRATVLVPAESRYQVLRALNEPNLNARVVGI